MNHSSPVLTAVGLKRAIGDKLIVDDFSFDFYPEKIYTLLGPSGAGKSSLLRLLNRLDEPTAGKVAFEGKDHCDFAPCRLRRDVGFLFQTAHLFPGTVRDNVLFANDALSEAEVIELLKRSAVKASMLDSPVDNLSGGEAQRVALARMLATSPKVVLLDEPTSALDPTTTETIEESIRHLAVEDRLCVIMVTHNPDQALRIGGETLLLVDGRLVEHGEAEQVISNPRSTEGKRYKNRERE